MKKIVIKSPTRVDLAGGTLDLWPVYNFIGGAKTVNLAINIYTTVELSPRSDSIIEVISPDLKYEHRFANLQECLNEPNELLSLIKAQLRYWRPTTGLTLLTRSESPVGGGLGASSSLTISLLKAFSQLMKMPFASIHQLVQVAHNIEAEVLHTPTGTQDYYPAACGGLNILDYSARGIQQELLPSIDPEFEKNFILVYTGKSHHSGLNNFEVLTRVVKKDPQTLKALQDLKLVSEEMSKSVRQQHYQNLPQLFRQEYAARVQLADAFSSPEIDKLHEVALQAGAQAVKICGAGGGGCVLIWAHPDKRQNVVKECEKHGYKVLNAKPVMPLL